MKRRAFNIYLSGQERELLAAAAEAEDFALGTFIRRAAIAEAKRVLVVRDAQEARSERR